MKKKAASLAAELSMLQDALEALRLLCDADKESLGTEYDTEKRPKAIAAVAAIIGCRVELLRGAIRRSTDPALLWAPHNASPPKLSPGDDPDVILVAWTDAERARHFRLRAESPLKRRQREAEESEGEDEG